MFFSGIVRQVKNKVILLSGVALFVIAWNDVVVASYHPEWPHLVLPILPFSLLSPALGLLLVFRTNTSYQRWSEARQRWSTIVSQSKNMVCMACTFSDFTENVSKQRVEHLGLYTWVVAQTMMYRLAGEREDRVVYEKQLKDALSEEEQSPALMSELLTAPYPVAIALMEASLALDDVPYDEKQRVKTDKSLVILGKTWAACECIFTARQDRWCTSCIL